MFVQNWTGDKLLGKNRTGDKIKKKWTGHSYFWPVSAPPCIKNCRYNNYIYIFSNNITRSLICLILNVAELMANPAIFHILPLLFQYFKSLFLLIIMQWKDLQSMILTGTISWKIFILTQCE